MAKHALSDQLDAAVEVLMANPDAPLPTVDPKLAALLQLAAELRDLPHPDFKAVLKTDLERAGTTAVEPIPEGYHTATPCLVIRDAARGIEFYQRAFGATELLRHADPSGKIVHAEIRVGDSRIAIADEATDWGNHSPQALGGSPVIMSLYVPDVDALASQAVAAGATMIYPVTDQFYGDRSGRLADPFGHIWIVATHKEDVSAEQLQQRVAAWAGEQAVATPTIARPSSVARVHLPVAGASELISFVKDVFGAEEVSRHLDAEGAIAHAELRIGDSLISASDPTVVAPSPTALHVYVENLDDVYQRALRAGASSIEPPAHQDYGERSASLKDPFGNHWYIATADGPRYVPEGLPTVMPYLHPHGAPQLIEFMKHAFGADEMLRAQAPDGVVHHAKLRIGESIVEMGEAHGPYQPMATVFHLYVDDPDAAYRRALNAAGIALSEPADQPWGYRNAGIQDPCGNQWWINAPIPISPAAATETTTASPSLRTLTPFLQVREVAKTLDFLRAAFDAEVILFDRGGDPPHDHADLRIGDSMMMMGEVVPGYELTSSAFYLSVSDVDTCHRRALQAGASSQEAPTDKPWGDRMAHVKDPFGNSWFIATKKKDSPH